MNTTLVLCLMLALFLALYLNATAARAADPGDVIPMHLTYYEPTGNPTASGQWPYDGSAGCSYDIPLFSRFALPGGNVVVCNDRGADGFMAPHLDLFCPYSASVCMGLPGVGNWTAPVPVTVLSWGG